MSMSVKIQIHSYPAGETNIKHTVNNIFPDVLHRIIHVFLHVVHVQKHRNLQQNMIS